MEKNLKGYTPTPWMTEGDDSSIHIFTEHMAHIATISEQDDERETEANAAFIVRACNSHEALLSALKDCMGDLEIWEKGGTVLGYTALDKARAALKLAGKE